MTGISVEQPDGSAAPSTVLLSGERWAAVARVHDKKFWAGLAAALLLHSLLLIGINLSKPKQIGDPSGADNAISVDLVTQADLESRATVAEKGGAGPGVPVPQTPPVETPPPPQQQSEAKPEVTPEPPVETPAETKSEQAPPEPEAKPEQEKPSEAKAELDVPDALALPGEGAEPAKKAPDAQPPAKPIEKQQAKPQSKPPQKKTAALDLTMPAIDFSAPVTSGRVSVGTARPPGITRSGANDEFGKRVIRNLSQTFPQLSDTVGQVTVRIVVSQEGNLAEVKILEASNVAILDQSVVFAVQQTSFPFPPPNSKDVDRTFYVRYLYRYR